MNALLSDLRFGIRGFARRPTFTLTAIVSLALGIAATTTIFSLVNTALLKGVPGVTRTERLVEISRSVNGQWSSFRMAGVRR